MHSHHIIPTGPATASLPNLTEADSSAGEFPRLPTGGLLPFLYGVDTHWVFHSLQGQAGQWH